MIISSQRYINQDTVSANIDRQDYEVTLSPEFELDGETYQVVLDGHHAYHAAITAGVEPEFVEADSSDNDTICLLNEGFIEDFLAANYMDADWYDIRTGRDIW